jgi:hypothetical protein
MTLLEYAIQCEIGPPTTSKGNGESTWPFPKCGNERFHTRPSHPTFPERFNCPNCDFWGDIWDLLRHFHPGECFDPERKTRKVALEKQFAQRKAKEDKAHAEFFSRKYGDRGVFGLTHTGELFGMDRKSYQLAIAFECLSEARRRLLQWFKIYAEDSGVSLDDLAENGADLFSKKMQVQAQWKSEHEAELERYGLGRNASPPARE